MLTQVFLLLVRHATSFQLVIESTGLLKRKSDFVGWTRTLALSRWLKVDRCLLSNHRTPHLRIPSSLYAICWSLIRTQRDSTESRMTAWKSNRSWSGIKCTPKRGDLIIRTQVNWFSEFASFDNRAGLRRSLRNAERVELWFSLLLDPLRLVSSLGRKALSSDLYSQHCFAFNPASCWFSIRTQMLTRRRLLNRSKVRVNHRAMPSAALTRSSSSSISVNELLRGTQPRRCNHRCRAISHFALGSLSHLSSWIIYREWNGKLVQYQFARRTRVGS